MLVLLHPEIQAAPLLTVLRIPEETRKHRIPGHPIGPHNVFRADAELAQEGPAVCFYR